MPNDEVSARTKTQSIDTGVDPDRVFKVLADPRHLPQWAPGFADEIAGDAQEGWQVLKNGRTFPIRLVIADPAQSERTVQYLREIAPGREAGAVIRILPRETGSMIMMTLPVAPGADPESVAAIIREELQSLVRIAEKTGPDLGINYFQPL